MEGGHYLKSPRKRIHESLPEVRILFEINHKGGALIKITQNGWKHYLNSIRKWGGTF